jgi:hypothetical protein
MNEVRLRHVLALCLCTLIAITTDLSSVWLPHHVHAMAPLPFSFLYHHCSALRK